MEITEQAFLRAFEAALELDEGSVQLSVALEEIDEWDSLGTVSLIAIVDERFGVTLAPDALYEATSPQDLFDHLKAMASNTQA